MRGRHCTGIESFPARGPLVFGIEARHARGRRIGLGMRIEHRRCCRVGSFRDSHLSHHRVTRDVAGRYSAKIKPRLSGRHWRRRSKLRWRSKLVLNERRWRAGRKCPEDRNDRNQRDKWARRWPRLDRDHGWKPITTDSAPTTHRHAPPPTVYKSASRSGQNDGANRTGGRLITVLLGCDGFATPLDPLKPGRIVSG